MSSCKIQENEELGLGFSCLNADTMGDPASYCFRKVQVYSNLVSSHIPLDTRVYASESPSRLLHIAAHYTTFVIRL